MRKINAIKGRVLTPPMSVAQRIIKEMDALIVQMCDEYQQAMTLLFSGGYGVKQSVMDAMPGSFAVQAEFVLGMMDDKFTQAFEFKANEWAEQLSYGALDAVDVQLRATLKDISKDWTLSTAQLKSGKLADTFQALTQENANLFKTIPAIYHSKVQQAVSDSIVNGNGLQDLVPFFQEQSNGTRNYAKLRAMDQTRKAFTGLAATRMQSAGFEEFEWIHTSGAKVPRKLHIELNRKVFRFDDPPFIGRMYGQDIYGLPGTLPGCRCIMRIVIKRLKADDNMA